MFQIALFAIIGAIINANPAYWIVYGFFCVVWFFKFMYDIGKNMK